MSELTQSYVDHPSDEALLNDTLGEYFDRIVERFPNREALVVKHQNIRWTYREYQREIELIAKGLLALGIDVGDRVGIWGPNSVQWCLTQLATAKIGAILVCINPAYRSSELEYALNKVECRALITAESFKSSDYLAMLHELAPELKTCTPGALNARRLPALNTVISLSDKHQPGLFKFSDIARLAGDKEAATLQRLKSTLRAQDAINIQFTSGTTGQPKGATLSHHSILNNALQVAQGMALSERDRLCIPVPLYHCFGMVMGHLGAITVGATAVFPSAAFEPLSVLQTVHEEKCTALYGVPTMFLALLEHPTFSDFDMSSLRTGIMGGAPCPEILMKRVMNELHMPEVTIMYGQTETSPVNHMTGINDPLEKRVASVGRCAPHLTIKIIDEQGAVVPIGDKGELCCRGYSVMIGYWGDQAQTQATIDNEGWLHSGDLAIMDGEGYVQIVGRLKDLIIRGGENIYPQEIEHFLLTHPAIADAQVFGVPDEKYGEEVCVWFKVKPGEVLHSEALKEFCKGKIAHYKVPRYLRRVDEFPMTVTGKIQKFVMRESMMKMLADKEDTIECVAYRLPLSPLLSEDTCRALRQAKQTQAAMIAAATPLPEGSLNEQRQWQCEQFYQSDFYQTLRAQFPVEIELAELGGVRVEQFTPAAGISAKNQPRVLINLHGGGFEAGAGDASQMASIPVAAMGRVKVISVHYRLAPEHHFPAATDDVVAVYQALLKDYRPEHIGIYGTSAGAILSAQTVVRLQQLGLPLPGAIAMLSGAAAKLEGDSLEFADSIARGVDGTDLKAYLQLDYYQGADLNNPELHPVFSDAFMARFPPSLLASSSRDYLLSSVLVTHRKLLQQGVQTELHVWEGLDHNFHYNPALPESEDLHRTLLGFFDRHLG